MKKEVQMSVRVRYAPSPTGLQHIGGVRTAVFNYFFAKSSGGKFILRIEDTDRERYNDESLQDLYETLNWLGITWDEGPDKDGGYGPYVQSERFEIYREYTEKLIESGHAYKCFCTEERLEQLREEQKKTKSKEQGYDRHCSNLTAEEVDANLADGKPFVVRFRIPVEGKTTLTDVIMGEITRKNKDVSPDPIILKSDGFPTYHLANVIDDHMMGITHVLRAQEWIPTGPLHVLLYKAFGWEPPLYCHLPLVVGKDGSKLSKRHGSTSVREFRKGGYLPEAIINYISLLGWSFDDSREFFTKEDLEKLFNLEKINKAPAVFDYKKLDWFNGQYIRMKDHEELKELLMSVLIDDEVVSNPPTDKEKSVFDGAFPIIRERLKLTTDVSGLVRFLYTDELEWNSDDAVPKKMDKAGAVKMLELARTLLEGFDSRSDEENEELFSKTVEEQGIKLGDLMQPLRVAVTGTKMSPPMVQSLSLLGEKRALQRIDGLLSQLKSEI
ncbi:glutamyl-tRNA synthetase [Spirochaeta isovalerica]|uniref:Glutamate--tRNA ligase n=2 Tax=Spirochaeta isovalerica TaxID=150 RepID=A0A841R4W9_9SPIO|nr:glutamyl-tRNA synthetase [Spirochaeta isovalerica]